MKIDAYWMIWNYEKTLERRNLYLLQMNNVSILLLGSFLIVTVDENKCAE